MRSELAPARIVDISMPVTTRTVSWSDKYLPEPTWHSRTEDGQATTNSSWFLHCHTGTHVDAPAHHVAGGSTVGGLGLDAVIGPCRVLDLTRVDGHIDRGDLADADAGTGAEPGERLLFKTRNSTRRLAHLPGFDHDYVGLTPGGAAYLAERNVRLVGIDYLSIEPFGEHGFATHHTLLRAGVVVLEGLVLDHVAPGRYDLVFLPIALDDAEAAPGRAILLPPTGDEPTRDEPTHDKEPQR